jgi:hypothetical protein
MSEKPESLKDRIAREAAKRKTPPAETSSPTVSVSRMYKSDGKITSEESEDSQIDIIIPHHRANLAQIGCSAKILINLGDFENVQLGVSCVLPCYVEEIEEAYASAKKLVDLKLNKEVAAVREFKTSKGGS